MQSIKRMLCCVTDLNRRLLAVKHWGNQHSHPVGNATYKAR